MKSERFFPTSFSRVVPLLLDPTLSKCNDDDDGGHCKNRSLQTSAMAAFHNKKMTFISSLALFDGLHHLKVQLLLC